MAFSIRKQAEDNNTQNEEPLHDINEFTYKTLSLMARSIIAHSRMVLVIIAFSTLILSIMTLTTNTYVTTAVKSKVMFC